MNKLHLLVLVLVLFAARLPAGPELPRPEFGNTFHLFPIYEQFRNDDPAKRDQLVEAAADLRRVFGPTGLYSRLGFAIISNGGETGTFELARELGLGLVLQGGAIEHHSSEWGFGVLMDDPARTDRRLLQWYQDGSFEYIDPKHPPKALERARYEFLRRVSASRLAGAAYALREGRERARAARLAGAMRAFPETIVAVSGPIECEMHHTDAGRLWGDYGPFTVAEFRDYLTHCGLYAPGAERAGQGYPGGEVFSDDPAPGEARGGNKSFNAVFGTSFATWTLRYWDPQRFPERLALDAEGRPAAGVRGHVAKGFDAPRVEPGAKPAVAGLMSEGNDVFWNAWFGQRGPTPPFREKLLNFWIGDHTRWLREAGIPRERIYSHQIAGEGYGLGRLSRGASAAWTAHTPDGNIGITTYFDVAADARVFAQLSKLNPNWGIFEYHPHPIGSMDAPVSQYLRSLGLNVRFRSRILTPIAWNAGSHGKPEDFIVRAGPFADAIRETLRTLPDQPYMERGYTDYAPPPVHGIGRAVSPVKPAADGKVRVVWSPFIWEGLPQRWMDWREFTHFEVRDAGGKRLAVTGDCFVDLAGSVADSATVVAVKRARPPTLAMPRDLTAKANRLSWVETYDFYLDHYRVAFFSDEKAAEPYAVETTRTARFELTLTGGRGEVWVEVAAAMADGKSGPATPRLRVALPKVEAAGGARVVGLIAASKADYGRVTLRWDERGSDGRFWAATPEFSAYRIYRGASAEFEPTRERRIGQSEGNEFVDEKFDGSETYYRVTTLLKDGGETTPSEAIQYAP